MRIDGTIPVEVDMDILLETQTGVPEEFREVVVEQPLHVVSARLDTQHRHVFYGDGSLEFDKGFTEFGQRAHAVPCLLVREVCDLRPHEVIGELADRPFQAVNVKVKIPPPGCSTLAASVMASRVDGVW